VVELNEGRVRTFTLLPEQAGLARAPVAAIGGGDAEANAAALRALLGGAGGPYRDTVLLNAAAALIIADRAADLREGVSLAARVIESGAAQAALDALRRETAADAR
jgi:anthranilate phosphoribosyltransferase